MYYILLNQFIELYLALTLNNPKEDFVLRTSGKDLAVVQSTIVQDLFRTPLLVNSKLFPTQLSSTRKRNVSRI